MVSVVIVNWNTRDLLHNCLATLQEELTSNDEIIVVDNCSTDGSAEMVRERFPLVKLSAEKSNWGYAKGNNLGFLLSSQPFVLTLNSDTEIPAGSIQTALNRLIALPQYGCATVRLQGKDGETQKSVRGFPSIQGIFGDLSGLGRRAPNSRWDSYRMTGFDYGMTQDAPQPMGTYLLFRREALEEIGAAKEPFDEQFPIFFNEVDLLYRLHAAGWPCRYFADLHVIHYGGESTKQVKKPMVWESHKSLLRYLKKHQLKGIGVLALPLLALLIYGAAMLRARGYHAGFRPQR
jgi:GT2 family glycosyltransferase